MSSLEFVLGILDSLRATVAWEDLQGTHGNALLLLQEMGLLDREPGHNPVPSCPHCGEGVPYFLRQRYLCNRCHSGVDSRHLLLWQLHRQAFLNWLATALALRGGVRQIDACLWQLGTWEAGGLVCECFYRCRGVVSDAGKRKMLAYRSAVVLYGLARPSEGDAPTAALVSLLEILCLEQAL